MTYVSRNNTSLGGPYESQLGADGGWLCVWTCVLFNAEARREFLDPGVSEGYLKDMGGGK